MKSERQESKSGKSKARELREARAAKFVDPGQSRRDKMIADGSLIIADLSKQAPNGSYCPPTEYRDTEFECVDCGKSECWTAKQQQWWYEVAKGQVNSRAIRCRECRRIDRLVRKAAQWPIARKPIGVLMDTDDSQIRRMKQVLGKLVPDLVLVTRLMSGRWYQSFSHVLPGTRFLSLGCNWLSCQQERNSDKPGKFLECFIRRQPRCPVLIHGAKTESSRMAVGSLRLSRWEVAEVESDNVDWIESGWRNAVSSLLKLKSAG